MIRSLLLRGLLAGVVAGLLAGTFAFAFGEPLLQDAIDIEEGASAHASLTPASLSPLIADAGELLPRSGQRAGLFLASTLYGGCVGIAFALAFALVRGRGAVRDDWQLSVRIAAGLFAAAVLVPFLKYPANPPAVGAPETIAVRTWLYLAMVCGGLLSLLAAARVMWSVPDRVAPWVRQLLGAGTFVALVGFLALVLPAVDEVPKGFPASLLWQFRLSALGTQAVLWTALGIVFGMLSVRAASSRSSAKATTS